MTHKFSQSGFTIIETILFLAISSLMIVTAMSAVRGRSEEVQYTDAVRSVESFIQSQVLAVRNSVILLPEQGCSVNGAGNPRAANTSDGSCVFLGYMYEINSGVETDRDPPKDEIHVYQMYGRRLSSAAMNQCIADAGGDTENALYCSRPTAIPGVRVETFNIPWSTEISFFEGYRIAGMPTGYSKAAMLGYFRDPNGGGSVIPVIFPASYDSGNISTAEAYRVSNGDTSVGGEVSGHFCIDNGERQTGLSVANHENQLSAEVVYYIPGCTP